MKINERLEIAEHVKASQDNYQFIVADESDIADAVWKKDDSKLWTRREVLDSLRSGGEAVKIWFAILKEGVPLFAQVQKCHNIVPSVLRNSLATLISGTTVTPSFKANYFALGSSSTAASNADTQLGTETLRAAFTDRSAYANVAYLDVFFPTASVGGNTYNEAGIFVDGTGSANSGYLLSRVMINQTLGSSQTLTVNCSITVS